MENKIIICIPGIWKNHEELASSINELHEEYIFAGKIIMSTINSDKFGTIEHYDYCNDVTESFKLYRDDRFTDEELNNIYNHESVIYVTCDTGNLENIINALNIGKILLKAGGLGIRIETSGIIHPKNNWLNFKTDEIVDLFHAFIIFVGDENEILSCGMHCFNKPEALISTNIKAYSYTLTEFLIYLISEDPVINEGQTFSAEKDMEILKIEKMLSSKHYEKDHVFYNKYNIWTLNANKSEE